MKFKCNKGEVNLTEKMFRIVGNATVIIGGCISNGILPTTTGNNSVLAGTALMLTGLAIPSIFSRIDDEQKTR